VIRDVYITRIKNEGEGNRKFGFGVTEDELQVYIPGQVITAFDLSEDDVGTKNKMYLAEDAKGRTDFVCHSLLIEDSALQQAYEWAKEEISRLETLMKDNGVDYD